MTDTEHNDSLDKMVLRTVYLPPELDEKLRVWAFRTKVSKGDVIRQAIAKELQTISGFGDDAEPPKSASASKPKSVKASEKRAVTHTKARNTKG